MKIEKINYQKAFVVGPYLQEKIGLEAQLDEGDDPDTCLQQLKGMVNGMGTVMEAALMQQQDTVRIEPRQSGTVGAIINDMNSCKEKKVLETYRIIAKRSPELQAAYDKKMSELWESTA